MSDVTILLLFDSLLKLTVGIANAPRVHHQFQTWHAIEKEKELCAQHVQ